MNGVNVLAWVMAIILSPVALFIAYVFFSVMREMLSDWWLTRKVGAGHADVETNPTEKDEDTAHLKEVIRSSVESYEKNGKRTIHNYERQREY